MPTAFIALEDRAQRERIAGALHRRGWSVSAHATGFHLLSELADVIDGKARDMPGLIVVDAFARGCAGLTIAAGLRDLGVALPLVLVTRPGVQLPVTDDATVRVAGPETALRVIAELAGDPPRPPPASSALSA
jgi:FixJ family two-component response regulator